MLRSIDDSQNGVSRFSDHRSRRIADGAAERTLRISQHRTSRKMPRTFSDAFVHLIVRAVPEADGRSDFVPIVQTIGPAGLDRPQISNVHHIRHVVQALALHYSAHQ